MNGRLLGAGFIFAALLFFVILLRQFRKMRSGSSGQLEPNNAKKGVINDWHTASTTAPPFVPGKKCRTIVGYRDRQL